MDEDLIAFWRVRLDEEEATARYAGPSRIAWLTFRDGGGQMSYTTVAAADHGDQDLWLADGKVLPVPASARVVYDPAAVLADIEADREILRMLQRELVIYEALAPLAGRADSDISECAELLWQVAKIRASRFSAHPEYREDWKP